METPLHVACSRGHLNMVRMLISEFKADMYIVNWSNNTPLHVVAIQGNEDVALALINEFGCDSNIRGVIGRTVLHSASVYVITMLMSMHKTMITTRHFARQRNMVKKT